MGPGGFEPPILGLLGMVFLIILGFFLANPSKVFLVTFESCVAHVQVMSIGIRLTMCKAYQTC